MISHTEHIHVPMHANTVTWEHEPPRVIRANVVASSAVLSSQMSGQTCPCLSASMNAPVASAEGGGMT